MRFLTPPQTISEYRHQQMPVYETIAAVGATTIIGSLTVGGLASAAATAGAGALASYGVSKLMGGGSSSGGGGGGGGMPSYGYNAPSGTDIFQSAADNALAYAPKFTQQNINLQNKVTPGSSAQRATALKLINSYMAGEVPLDVQQNTQRAIAQSFGGGYNPFTGGGQAPSAYARNIGQTSVGLSQYGLSAAPTWQQLANSMVTRPDALMSFGMQAEQLSLGGNLQAAENQYQSGMNQYKANQLQNQQNQQMIMQGANSGLDIFKSAMKGGYLNSLSPSGQGAAATLGALPSASTANSYMNDLGYNPTSFTALPNTGAGTAYPFGQ
jgi:hypothetical protein